VRSGFLPLRGAAGRRTDGGVQADHALDRRQFVGRRRLRDRSPRAAAVQAQRKAFARARAVLREPVAQVERSAAVAGARHREAGEVFGHPAKRQVVARRHGARSKKREQRVIVLGDPPQVEIRGLRARARVRQHENGIGLIEHHEIAAARQVHLKLAQEAFRAGAEHLLVGLRGELEKGELAAPRVLREVKSGQAGLAQEHGGVAGRDERARLSSHERCREGAAGERQPHRLLIAGEAVDHARREPADARRHVIQPETGRGLPARDRARRYSADRCSDLPLSSFHIRPSFELVPAMVLRPFGQKGTVRMSLPACSIRTIRRSRTLRRKLRLGSFHDGAPRCRRGNGSP
jgi:hypothetical protein